MYSLAYILQVRIGAGPFEYHAGYLDYENNLWEHPPARYGIIGILCGLVLLASIVVLVCKCNKKNEADSSNDGHTAKINNGRNISHGNKQPYATENYDYDYLHPLDTGVEGTVDDVPSRPENAATSGTQGENEDPTYLTPVVEGKMHGTFDTSHTSPHRASADRSTCARSGSPRRVPRAVPDSPRYTAPAHP